MWCSIYLRKFLLTLLLGGFFLVPSAVEGKSVMGGGGVVVDYIYKSAPWESCSISGTNDFNFGDQIDISVGAEIIVNAYNNDTNTLINENTTIPSGTVVRFDTIFGDISWFENGKSYDSPNGFWVDSYPAPIYDCLFNEASGQPPTHNVYFKKPPINFSHSGSTAAYSCNGNGSLCTVTSGGVLATSTNFSPMRFMAHGKGLVMLNPIAPVYFGPTDGDMAVNISGLLYPINVANSNSAPGTPSLTGPTSGITNTNYTFTANASDGDGDTLKYGMDWDNNGSVDQWMPGSGFVASNTPQNFIRQWATPGSYTFKALAQDSNGANSGWSAPLTITIQNIVNGVCGLANAFPTTNPPIVGLCSSGTPTVVAPGIAPGPYSWTCQGSGGGTNSPVCTAPYLEPAPVVDLKINGSDGPITVNRNGNLNITWGNIPNAASCTGTGNSWTGAKATTGGNDNVSATAPSLYTLTCTNSQGASSSDSVSVTLQPTLKICQNSCSSSIEPPASFSMQKNDTKDLVACYNDATSCTDGTGDITTSATWSEGGGNPVSISGGTPKRVSADNPGTESISASYSGNTVTKNITVTCTDAGACQRDANYNKLCQKDTYTVVDSCGVTQSCTGIKTCDYNWKEVEP